MRPTDILIKEHDTILIMLNILEKVCIRLEVGENVEESDLENIVEFFKVFADKCHHRKEEDLLFPAMEQYGIPNKGGPIGIMLSEHDLGRDNVKGMNNSIDDYKQGKESGSIEFILYARDYIELLTNHIDKENNILFKIADTHIPEEGQRALLLEFEKADEENFCSGINDKYDQLLLELSRVYLNNHDCHCECSN